MVISRAGNIQITAADIVNSFVVHQEGTIRVLNSAVSGQNGVIRLNDRSRHARRGVDGELELGLLAVLGGETLEQKRAETRASTSTKRVEDQEALQRRAVV